MGGNKVRSSSPASWSSIPWRLLLTHPVHPDTKTHSPSMTAREYPIAASKAEPLLSSLRDIVVWFCNIRTVVSMMENKELEIQSVGFCYNRTAWLIAHCGSWMVDQNSCHSPCSVQENKTLKEQFAESSICSRWMSAKFISFILIPISYWEFPKYMLWPSEA